MILISLVCLREVDLKIIVAYSSVVHMGLLLRGQLRGLDLRLEGGVLIIVAHGLCSSALFYLIGIMYISRGRRLVLLNKGLINIIPFYSL